MGRGNFSAEAAMMNAPPAGADDANIEAEALRARARAAEERLATVLERTIDAVYEIDRDWRITFVNDSARTEDGDDFEGMDYWEACSSLLGTPIEQFYRRAFAATEPSAFEYLCPLTKIWYSAFCLPSATGMTMFYRDIDIQKQAEVELREAKEKAERASLTKSRFLAAASHDLRQPVQSLFFFADSLRHDVENDRGREKLIQLERGLDTMKQLLDRLLDVSRLDIGEAKPSLDDFPVHLIFEHLRTIFAPVAASRGLMLDIVPNDVLVRSDPLLLSRLLRNLVENSIRYTEKGGIRVQATRVQEGVRLSVEDTGVGIAENHLEKIWEEFYQVGNPERDRQQGLGLGLPIVRRMAGLLGHTVEVQSDVTVGTTFTVLVPEAPKTFSAAKYGIEIKPDMPDVCGSGRFIVVVDDDAMVLMALQMMLEDWGYEVLVAGSAQQALDLLRKRTRDPDIVIADYRLREGKIGTDAVMQIREMVGKATPALLLTGEAAVECRQDAVAHGLGFLQKPVTPRYLSAVLEKTMGSNGSDPLN